jgi:protein O-mannosyl-transferase
MPSRKPIRGRKFRSPPSQTKSPKIRPARIIYWAITVTLAATVVAIYTPSLDFQFILDDHHFVNDPRVQSAGHIWEYFVSYVWAQVSGGPPSFYRPMFILWLRLNAMLSGMSPWGWHLLSISKHLVAAILLGILTWKLLRDRIAALLAAALFALHPAHTESVAWVTVPDPLMSAAAFGSLLLYFGYTSGAGKPGKRSTKEINISRRNSRSWWIASALCCLIALLAKETAVVLPVIIFVVSMVFGKNEIGNEATPINLRTRFVGALRESIPFIVATAIYLLLRLNALSGRIGNLTQHLSWRTILLSVPATLWFYVKVLVWPIRSYAFADSSQTDTWSRSGVLWPVLAVGFCVVVLAIGLRWGWNKTYDLPPDRSTGVQRALVLGTLILVLPILLALNLNALDPGDYLHGRYTYLPSAGLMLLLASAWYLSKRPIRTVLLIAAGLLGVAFAVMTVKQEDMWRDDLTVYTVAHKIAPNNAPVALNFARARVQNALSLDEQGRCDEALPIFGEIVKEYPQDWYAWAGQGDCFLQLKDLPQAEVSFHRAADLSHEPRVTQEWEEIRARISGTSPTR